MPALDAAALVAAVPALAARARPAGAHARRLAGRPRERRRRAGDRPRRGRRGRGRPRRRRHARHRHARGDRRAVRPAARRRRADRAHRRDPARRRRPAPTGRRTCSTPSAPPATRRPPGSARSSRSRGELHAARAVRKADSVSPRAFASPRAGPLGRVSEERVEVWAAPGARARRCRSRSSTRAWRSSPPALGSDGALVDAALAAGADGLVAVLLGAGHAPPAFLAACRPPRPQRARSSPACGRSRAGSCAPPTASRAPSATSARRA